MHIHISFVHAFMTFLEFLLAWIPVKMLAANFTGKSSLADAVYGVL